jgi:hypothetical protein
VDETHLGHHHWLWGAVVSWNAASMHVTIATVPEENTLLQTAVETETEMANQTPVDFCRSKSKQQHPWGF